MRLVSLKILYLQMVCRTHDPILTFVEPNLALK